MRFGIKIGAPREGGADADGVAGATLCDPRRRFVFPDVARLKPRDRHVADARGGERLDIGLRKHAAFLQKPVSRAHGMRQDGA